MIATPPMMLCPTCAAVYPDGTVCPRDAAALLSTSGDPLLGLELSRYRLISVIGRGGMGTVYRAVHIQIRSQVAIKVLTKAAARDKDIVDRFFAEARAVNLIRNDNIVSVMDMASLPDGRPYLVMELLEGASLKQRQRKGDLTLQQRIQVMQDVLVALAAAHDKGILHRDVKPENIFVCSNGRTKLLDFGIAKVQHAKSLMVYTETGIVMGTPQYMAPEQARGASLDARVDIYAVGCVLYELVTGHLPFEHDGLFEVLRQHIEDAPQPPRQRRPELSSGLEHVILTAMAKAREARFATAMAMHAALAALPDVRGADTVPAAVGATTGTPTLARGDASPSVTNLGHGAVVTHGLTVAETPQARPNMPHRGVAPAAISPGALFTDSVIHRPHVPTGALPLQPAALGAGAPADNAAALNLVTQPSSSLTQRLQRRWPVIAAVAAIVIAIVIVAAVKSSGGDQRGTAAVAKLGSYPGAAAPVIEPPWPRSTQEYEALLASRDPAIAAWAKQHPLGLATDEAAPSFVANDGTLDADAFIRYAIRRATEIDPDAQVMQVFVSELNDMGKVAHTQRSAMTVTFLAPSRATRPVSLAPDAPWDGLCVLYISFRGQLDRTTIGQSTSCFATSGRAPICKIAEVLAQARSQGLPLTATFRLSYNSSPTEGTWFVWDAATVEGIAVSDTCGVVVPPAAVPPTADPTTERTSPVPSSLRLPREHAGHTERDGMVDPFKSK